MTYKFDSSKYGIFLLAALPLLTQCEKKKEGDATGYHTPACDAGQYYDGNLGSCQALIEAVSVTGFTSFRDEDYLNRAARLQAFITQYFQSGYTFSAAPSCTEEVEYNPALNQGFYADTRDVSYNCAFTLVDAAGAEKLVFQTQDSTVGTAIAKDDNGKDAEGTERPEYANPFLKVVVSKDTDAAKLMLCTYSAERKSLYLTPENKYDPNFESDEVYATQTSCVPYGASAQIPASLKSETDATVRAFPMSLTAYLRGKRTKNLVNGNAAYKFAEEAISTTVIDTLNVNCGADGNFNIAATFTPSPDTPISGTVAITGDASTFFASSEVQGVDEFTYIKARSLLGCTTQECLAGEKAKGTYTFVGPYVYITFTGTDVWKYTTGSKVLGFASNSGGKDNVCDFGYTLKPKE
jgi:hypothetical protein